jgi:hypothetical protein
MRYIGSISSVTDFRTTNFTSILVATTSGQTSAICLCEAVKITRIGITCLPNSSSNAGTFAFIWKGDREPHTTETLIYANGVPAKWNFYPPEDSLASFWFTQDTSHLDDSSVFTLDPDNSTVKIVLDLEFEYVLASSASETVTLTSAASTTGIAAICMPSSATDELVPVDIYSVTI